MKKIVALAALAFIAAHASAADKTWYIGGDISSSQFKAEGEKERKTGFGATLGYSLNENVAFELQARRMGKWKEDGVSITANAIHASVLGIAPITKEFSLFGRLGMSRNSLDLSQGNATYSLHKSKALFGFGGDYAFDKNLSLRAEYVNLGSNKIGTGTDSVNVKIQQFNVGLNYAF
ncbi:outer membrane beta-barrel protein [Paucibacter sp. JuS9]|uniref:outer membrane beta-barrel protein n=1 Tax=Roseateles TaxID=93681 RepID=UPI002FE5432E